MLYEICNHKIVKLFPTHPTLSRAIYSRGKEGQERKMCSASSPPVKKDLSQPLSPKYRPAEVERGWYSWWEGRGFFRRSGAVEKFVMVLPPPNVTGTLHLGHALTCSVQDAITRWHQMRGAEVVFVPGCDHAGIATQAVVERHLLASQGKTRHQLGRQRFVEEVWKWKEEKGSTIYQQMKRLGTGLDWDRAVFTMDKHMSEAVNEAFIRLFNLGLVYRKRAPVNWCCSLQSTISDIEVEHIHLTGPTELTVPGYEYPVTFGKMYDFAYKVIGSEEELVVSTTRLETMLGDTAIMVHPEDSRYSRFVGKTVLHPFRRQPIPVIADEGVDPDFGTGVVKVTPGHSQEDFEVGQRHNLEQITVLDEQGRVTNVVPEFESLPRFAARDNIVDALRTLGLFRSCHPHPMMLPLCTRTQDVVEALLKPQWFVRCSEMAAEAIKAVRTGELQIHPETCRKRWQEWLGNDMDWCVSRQLWWGHRIPVYRVVCDGGQEYWVAARSEEDARRRAVEKEGVAESSIKSVVQDEDVLDTWFSSGIYPFAVFGWPLETADLRTLYPTTLLETGHDILFFWVARMVMLAQRLTGELPFKTVLLHGLMCDTEGHKMSKSKGNIVDPLDIITGVSAEELKKRQQPAGAAVMFPKGIPECGADALRFTLCSSNIKNQLLSIDMVRAEQNQFMGNKIWQTVRFLKSAANRVAGGEQLASYVHPTQREQLGLMDRWILSQLSGLVRSANQNFETYDLHLVTMAFTTFWQNSLCDVYLESIKPVLNSGSDQAKASVLQTLWTSVEVGLHILSPFMPFLTEELYHRLPRLTPGFESIMQCDYPDTKEWSVWRDQEVEEKGAKILQVTAALRGLRAQHSVSYKKSQGTVVTSETQLVTTLRNNLDVVKTLGKISSVIVIPGPAAPPPISAVTTLSHTTSVYLHLQNTLNVEMELTRLRKRAGKLKKELNRLENRTSSPKYLEKTPESVQESHKKKFTLMTSELAQLEVLIMKIQET